MILENPATVKLLSALVEVGHRGATREYLQQKTGIGKTTFYRVLKPLLSRGIIREVDSLFRMPLEHPYNYLFKRLHAIERIEELPHLIRERVVSVVDHAKAHLGHHLQALWLVGSTAHQTMGPDSDLDFLAVLDSEIEYLPDLAYDVQFICMSTEEFHERWGVKNDFVLTALRHGILIEDKGFAQPFYLQPLPVQLKGSEFHSDSQELEEEKERFTLFVQSKARSEAEQALSHYAISILRRMLRVYNVLPAGKPDLLRACRLIFGAPLCKELQLALAPAESRDSKTWASDLMKSCHRLEEVYKRFSSHLAHFQKFAALVTSSGNRFEELVMQALQEITQTKVHRHLTVTGSDGSLNFHEQRWLIEAKSFKGPFTDAPIHQMAGYLARERGQAKGLIIANLYTGIPLLERPEAFSTKDHIKAAELNIVLRSALEVLCALNRSLLESSKPELFETLFSSREAPAVPS